MSERGARVLAEVLTAHWKRKGHEVTFRVIEAHDSNSNHLWCIRSELVGGLPKRNGK